MILLLGYITKVVRSIWSIIILKYRLLAEEVLTQDTQKG